MKAILFIVMFLALMIPSHVVASTQQIKNQFITIVNPVRISAYNLSPAKSLKAQYQQIQEHQLPATWLFTYDTLNNQDLVALSQQMNKLQEIGVLLEVTPSFANAASVNYKETDSWHRAKALFLSGYNQDERMRLIDTVFSKYKDLFGFYPTSVGAWWVDSFSLNYMKNKYHISANLSCADQFLTDGYSIWGQFWSTPYYPSKFHAGIPANSKDNKIDLVTLQWAARDPVNGYGPGRSSTYSTQDYHINGLSINYYEDLLRLYLQNHDNKFGQITLGLEADLNEAVYSGLFKQHLDLVNKLVVEGVKVTTMKDFSSWYRQNFSDLSPVQVIKSDDLIAKKGTVIWYQSPFYRLALYNDKVAKTIQIIDFRVYPNNFQEPFFSSINDQMDLFINIPSLIDKVSNQNKIWNLPEGILGTPFRNGEQLEIAYQEKGVVTLKPSSLSFSNLSINLPEYFEHSKLIQIEHFDKDTVINIGTSWPVGSEGIKIKSYPPQILYLLNYHNLTKPQNRSRVIIGGGIIFLCMLLFIKIISYKKKYPSKRLIVLSLLLIFIISKYKPNWYYISQSELDALYQLQSLPEGKVLVSDRYCLKCPWSTSYMPAAFVNERGYITEISNKKIEYNHTFLVDQTLEQSIQEYKKITTKYIYLVKYPGYLEKLPFNADNYNLEKIYENANAQIWQVKK